MQEKKKHTDDLNKRQQAVDKAPGEERGSGEQIIKQDVKGKKNRCRSFKAGR